MTFIASLTSGLILVVAIGLDPSSSGRQGVSIPKTVLMGGRSALTTGVSDKKDKLRVVGVGAVRTLTPQRGLARFFLAGCSSADGLGKGSELLLHVAHESRCLASARSYP